MIISTTIGVVVGGVILYFLFSFFTKYKEEKKLREIHGSKISEEITKAIHRDANAKIFGGIIILILVYLGTFLSPNIQTFFKYAWIGITFLFTIFLIFVSLFPQNKK